MPKIKTKEAFITKTNRVISRGAGEEINMPDADYEEVKDKVELIEKKEAKAIKNKMVSESKTHTKRY